MGGFHDGLRLSRRYSYRDVPTDGQRSTSTTATFVSESGASKLYDTRRPVASRRDPTETSSSVSILERKGCSMISFAATTGRYRLPAKRDLPVDLATQARVTGRSRLAGKRYLPEEPPAFV